MITTDFEPPSVQTFLRDFKGVDLVEVESCLAPHLDLLLTEECQKWLSMAQGISLNGATAELELLYLAHTAPNALLFGLAYGKYIDALAMRQPHASVRALNQIRFASTLERSAVFQRLREEVLARGYALECQAEEDEDSESDFFDQDCMLSQSRSEVSELLGQLAVAKSPFVVGQLLSWLFLAGCQATATESCAGLDISIKAENDEFFYASGSYIFPTGSHMVSLATV